VFKTIRVEPRVLALVPGHSLCPETGAIFNLVLPKLKKSLANCIDSLKQNQCSLCENYEGGYFLWQTNQWKQSYL